MLRASLVNLREQGRTILSMPASARESSDKRPSGQESARRRDPLWSSFDGIDLGCGLSELKL